jgi:hypothetical protein
VCGVRTRSARRHGRPQGPDTHQPSDEARCTSHRRHSRGTFSVDSDSAVVICDAVGVCCCCCCCGVVGGKPRSLSLSLSLCVPVMANLNTQFLIRFAERFAPVLRNSKFKDEGVLTPEEVREGTQARGGGGRRSSVCVCVKRVCVCVRLPQCAGRLALVRMLWYTLSVPDTHTPTHTHTQTLTCALCVSMFGSGTVCGGRRVSRLQVPHVVVVWGRLRSSAPTCTHT